MIKNGYYTVAIWTGDDGRNYDLFIEQTTNPTDTVNVTRDYEHGSNVSEDTYTYTYTYVAAGTYKVVLIATNVGKDGDEVKQVKAELSITVTE